MVLSASYYSPPLLLFLILLVSLTNMSYVIGDNDSPNDIFTEDELDKTVLIYGGAYYEFVHPNSWTPIYVRYTPYVNGRYLLDGKQYRYYPISFFVYNRLTFDEENTMFSELIDLASPLLDKSLYYVEGYDQPAKIGPILLVDVFHAYSNAILNSPVNMSKVFERYDDKYNNYNTRYKPFAETISYYNDASYNNERDPIAVLTNLSSIAVFYVPTDPNLIATIGYDPRNNIYIVSSALLLSILNNNDKLAELVYLNPFKYMYMFNERRGGMPDIVVLLSPAAGLTDDDYNFLQNIGYKRHGGWISLPELFRRMGAKVVVGVKIVPDTFKYIKIETGNNKAKYIDTQSVFPYIARPWLENFLDYLSDGYTVKEAAIQAVKHMEYHQGEIFYTWHHYMQSLLSSSDIVKEIPNLIQTLIENVKKAGKISALIDILINVMFMIPTRINDLMYPKEVTKILKDYYNFVFEAEKNFIEKYYDKSVSGIPNIVVYQLRYILRSFIINNSDIMSKILFHISPFTHPLSVTIYGWEDYKLGAVQSPSSGDGDGEHFIL